MGSIDDKMNSIMKKNRFISVRTKMLIVFGCLVLIVVASQSLLGIFIGKKAVAEKVERHLIDKANDTAEIIDAKVMAFLGFIQGTARMEVLRDKNLSYTEKLLRIKPEMRFNERVLNFRICDTNSMCYAESGETINVSDREWYNTAIKGTPFVSDPYFSRFTNQLVMTLSVPIYDESMQIIGVLSANTSGTKLSEDIAHITIGDTGFCFILGLTGTTIAHKDPKFVVEQDNFQERAKADPTFESLASFVRQAVKKIETTTGYYTFKGEAMIAAHAAMKTTGWSVIIRAPVDEFMGTISFLQRSMIIAGGIFIFATLLCVYIIAVKMVTPLKHIVSALEDIAHGEGNLRTRLPLVNNDEITLVSDYFNRTMEKISSAISVIGNDTIVMKDIGNTLAGNMTQTATSVYEISENVESIQGQTVTQTTSLHETLATLDEMIQTIQQLYNSIESQASSVTESSSAIEEMVANIGSITETLQKTDTVIKDLANATLDGKEKLVTSHEITQKISEESGSLLEASSVIQHIAGQTNLLAMNAAIEAAHAGEAGKGFAVVADEIRKLAEESSMQGKTITLTLKNLSSEIEMLSSAADIVESKFNDIFTLSEQVKNMSNRLTEAMREQEHGSREVLIAIRDINTITVDVNGRAAEMLRGGEQITGEMHKLENITEIITKGMREMATSAGEITNAVQEVNDITIQNKQSIENLANEVQKFKV